MLRVWWKRNRIDWFSKRYSNKRFCTRYSGWWCLTITGNLTVDGTQTIVNTIV